MIQTEIVRKTNLTVTSKSPRSFISYWLVLQDWRKPKLSKLWKKKSLTFTNSFVNFIQDCEPILGTRSRREFTRVLTKKWKSDVQIWLTIPTPFAHQLRSWLVNLLHLTHLIGSWSVGGPAAGTAQFWRENLNFEFRQFSCILLGNSGL